MASCPLLTLPIEVRDLIFEFAITCEDPYDADDIREPSDYRIKRVSISNNNRWQWQVHHPSKAPIPEYLCLMLCNRQLNREIQDFLKRPQQKHRIPANLIVLAEYPNLWMRWTRLPDPPREIQTLDINIKVNHMYHPAYISQGSQNAILTAVSDTVKRFIYRGPHLSKATPLKRPLHLDNVKITLGPPSGSADMNQVYGFPGHQLDVLFNDFKALLTRFCRSGLPFGLIDAFDVRMEEKKWDRIPVTSNIWDENDFVFFQYGGFNWDGGRDVSDTSGYQPDLVAW